MAADGLQGTETDQYDPADTRYVAIENEQRELSGFARLLPTSRPYLLAEAFPELLDGASVPCSGDNWELSRFAALDLGALRSAPLARFGGSAAATLIGAVLGYADEQGARRLITDLR